MKRRKEVEERGWIKGPSECAREALGGERGEGVEEVEWRRIWSVLDGGGGEGMKENKEWVGWRRRRWRRRNEGKQGVGWVEEKEVEEKEIRKTGSGLGGGEGGGGE
ncbi:hypothetical protein Pcinc_033847 [Petrolisthes cinctipes]|uniref:Uncharacterized protein n=1 Tax=Petrolisthes cinctipes TaxID=88211 RepID=A0AAE1K0J5_PETCI|nr:hypothetical protein Pcinc_033847 [Petrolisthes cinctipes]